MRQEGGELAELRQRLAQADLDLIILRSANREVSETVAVLEGQLEKWIANGKASATKAEDLEEKLRCSICMDRPKDTAFACGHTCCGQCASECKKCYYNCTSERRQKPIT
ncbi:E3 ubiquitin-protein ligase RGLG2-like protein, partial [Aphelenchoides avenae]